MLPSFLFAFSLARPPEIAALFSSVACSCTSSPPPPFPLSPSVSAPAVVFPPSIAVTFPPSSAFFGYDFGVDPNIDPELALALRVSMEEERARQEAAAKRAAEEAGGKEGEPSSKSEDVTTKDQANVSSNEDKKHIDDMVEENDLLKEALAMSMNISGTGHSAGDTEMSEATSADQELALGSAITGPIGKEYADLWPRITSAANAIV